ncbi:caspase family protein [Litoreibacter albidus]|uniref:Caspase domain-containing protein n=1 Tax=Litoreibacter albidus TaxID=670155 RepID=A0A1H3DAP3_9RHOB|nr:caspase family protein [Litoreibacter albidus]SDX63208.1 Caspase domain-containing protein [Litoreibacter albidus]
MTHIFKGFGLLFERLTATVAVAFFMLVGPLYAQDRVALIIGNSEYDAIPALKNPQNDATAVGDALTNLGFKVTLLTDATSDQFWLKLDNFVKEAENAETTLFYYSGHAFQLEGANYLVPVNAQLKSRQAVFDETWSLDGIIKRLQARDRQTLIFLDACRDSPLPQNMTANGGGLARLNTGIGTFVAFATEPGAVTYDGQGDNSPFTTALLNHLETPSISISDMMIRVRNEVEERTLRRQTPWDQSSLRSQFYFQPEYENAPTLTAADYEMLAQLDPKGRERFLALLADSGIAVDAPAELIEGASLELAVADENSLIIAAAPIPASQPKEVPATSVEVTDAIRPEDVAIVDDVGLIFTVPDVVKSTERAVGSSGVAENVGPVVIELASLEQAPSNTLNRQTIDTFLPGSAPAATANGALDIRNIGPSGPTGSAAIASASGALSANGTADASAALARAGTEIAARAQGDIIRIAALTSPTRSVSASIFEAPTVIGREVLPDTDETRALLASIDPTLLEELTAPVEPGVEAPVVPEIDPKQMASDVQSELSRLGCYRMRVDGDWGNGSRRALTSYFLNKRIVPESLEPSLPLLRQLKSEGKVICQIQVARAKPKTVKKTTVKKAAAVKRAPAKKTAKKKVVRKISRVQPAAKGTSKKRITKMSTGVFR